MRRYVSTRTRLGLALAASSLLSVVLFILGVAANHTWAFSYLIWNLFLAWLPLLFMLWLGRVLRRKLWSSWQALALTLLWLGFLPNSFYLITDFIHLQEIPRADLLFDLVMFSSFVINGVLLGYISLFMVHVELLKRLPRRVCWGLVGGTLLLSSFAIYIGRDLRWNTWDVLFNPASILFDVSDRLLNPAAHPQIISTTLSFFVLLCMTYIVLWHGMRVARQQKVPE